MASAPALTPSDGWLRHDGWEYRGAPDDTVELRFRNGMSPKESPTVASKWRWKQWTGGKTDFDIVEYRKVGA